MSIKKINYPVKMVQAERMKGGAVDIAVVKFPGSYNNECQIKSALEHAGMQSRVFSWAEASEKLSNFQGVIIVGNLGDYPSWISAIAAFDPMMQAIEQQSLMGKPVLGIASGAQVLVEAGLVPGLERHELGMALTSHHSIHQPSEVNVCLAKGYQWNAFTRYLTPKEALRLPIDHTAGCFVIPPVLLAEIERNGLHVFQYCDENGNILDTSPVNPNNSIHNIAAIANQAGNVMAVVPHIENTPYVGFIFNSMRDYITAGYSAYSTVLRYQSRPPIIKKYQVPATAFEYAAELTAPDQHVMSVRNVLQRCGIPVEIKKTIHWEIHCDSSTVFQKIKKAESFFNGYKEKIMPFDVNHDSAQTTILVRAKDEKESHQQLKALREELGSQDIERIFCSVLWYVSAPEQDAITSLLHSNLLFNPYAYDCYYYE